MPTEAVPTAQPVYEAVQQLLATPPDHVHGVTASQIAAHTGLTVPAVLAALDLLASRMVVRLAQRGEPAAVIAVPVRRHPPREDQDHPTTANP